MDILLLFLGWLGLGVLFVTSAAVLYLLDRAGDRKARQAMLLALLATVLAGAACLATGRLAGGTIYVAAMALMAASPRRHVGLVWLKRRLRRRGASLSAFWQNVDNDYYWRGSAYQGVASGKPTELISAEAPVGRGTEPEASPAPAGCSGTADSVTDADGTRVPVAAREGPAGGDARPRP